MSEIVREIRERGCALQRDVLPVADLAAQTEQLFAMAAAGAFAGVMGADQRTALALG
ncbi:MAG: hypothetical protein HY060_24380, partial [Proteobacteria bacterium]|nr:hypothetical protein [Pseudomonadota bacterium]